MRSMAPTLLLLVACNQPRLVPANVDEDSSLPSVDLDGSRFYVRREGATSGVPIVFLAGGPGNDFLYLTRLTTSCEGGYLGDQHPLVFWDQRGSGLSRRHPTASLTFDAFRADLDALVGEFAPEGVILVGHSWGGQYATDFANRHPGLVRGLVLLAPGRLTQAIGDAPP